MERDLSAPPIALPEALASRLAGGGWRDVSGGFTGDTVWRVTLPDGSLAYLKRAAGPNRDELRREGERLRWLAGRLAVPEVLAIAEGGGESYLLSTPVPGLAASDPAFAERVPEVVCRLAEGLRRIHALPVAACPFDARIDVKLARAAERVRLGLVDPETFEDQHRLVLNAPDRDDGRAEWLVERVLEEARRTRPPEPEGDLVVTHGDYCLPNVLLAPDASAVTGYVDWGRAGVADRYQDLALGLRSLCYNWGPGWEPLFWDTYGIAQPDTVRLEYYELLDELF